MTLPKPPLLIAAAIAALALLMFLLTLTGGGLSAAEKRLVDRMEDTYKLCYADDLHTLDRVAACMEGKRLREETEARGLCRDLRGEDNGYRGIVRCDS